MKVKRVVLIVLDSVGIGYLPDAHEYGDEGSNTLGHIVERLPCIFIPNLVSMGLGNIEPENLIEKTSIPIASYGKAKEISAGKDTTTGHWEIAGSVLNKPFPTFLSGFPISFINSFESAIGVKTLGNYAASGTAIINELGDKHLHTGYPIVYTSADSVFQIAMHEDLIPLKRQYEICRIAREMLTGELEVGRVIARPFTGNSGNYYRTANRKDFATLPPDNILTAIQNHGMEVFAIGKISDIFAGKGITRYVKTNSNREGIYETIKALSGEKSGLIFTNLVDFDMVYGHRRDVEGYASCLEEFDNYLPDMIKTLHDDDLLIITADHGNDPTWDGTDHTREYIPILIYGSMINPGMDIGIRNSFSDIAASVADFLGIEFETVGLSFMDIVMKK
ncbi:MAG: phosphopentomutase [Saprospiraceae bacterium]|jgi:phosphopentomutase|nr:phosphopentomutase [Saprospiraceae bacterium]MBL0027423.1 phosphopentomutase [Saprospiraceae bacterium]